MKAWKLAAAVAALSSLPLLLLQACSSGDDCNGGCPADGGQDGTTSDAAPGDANNPDSTPPADGAAGCPTYNGSVAFCKAAVARCGACGADAAALNQCQLDNFDAVCNYVNDVFSSQYQGAVESCATLCDSNAESTCQTAALADASLSSAQQKVANDYCAKCGTGNGCAAQVAQQLSLIRLSDTLAGEVDQNCTPDAGGPDSAACGGSYGACALAVEFAALEGAPCADAGKD